MLLEGLHHAGEVQKGLAQAVHLVDHDVVDLASGDVLELRWLSVSLQASARRVSFWLTSCGLPKVSSLSTCFISWFVREDSRRL